MIHISTDCNCRDVEHLLNEINEKPGQALQVPLRIAHDAPFGVATQLVLAIAQWYQLNTGSARIHLAKNQVQPSEALDRLASTLHGMAAIWLSDSLAVGGAKDLRHDAIIAMAKYVLAMANADYGETIRGPHVLLSCFQGANNEFLPSLYAKKKRGYRDEVTGKEVVTVSSQGDFLKLLSNIEKKYQLVLIVL